MYSKIDIFPRPGHRLAPSLWRIAIPEAARLHPKKSKVQQPNPPLPPKQKANLQRPPPVRPITTSRLFRPRNAPQTELHITARTGRNIQGEASRSGHLVAQLSWTCFGRLCHEQSVTADGTQHGWELEYSPNGRLSWVAQWIKGKMHGLAAQFDEQGRVGFASLFSNGVGVDIFGCGSQVSEYREMSDGVPHGIVRWGNPEEPWCEEYFKAGKRHGIFRNWQDNRLEDSFPKFFLDDKEVDQQNYQRAANSDTSLPKYLPEDDRPARKKPKAVQESIQLAERLNSSLGRWPELEKLAELGTKLLAEI